MKTRLLFAFNNQSKALVIVLLGIGYWENLAAYSILSFGTIIEVWNCGRHRAGLRLQELVQNWMKITEKTAFIFDCICKIFVIEISIFEEKLVRDKQKVG